MFSLFKKRQPTLMDQTIKAIYGEKPPRKSANVADAVMLAADNLLCGTTDVGRLASLATELDAGPMPYSTHDLAVSIALRIFMDADQVNRPALFNAQLQARLAALDWAKQGKLAPALLQSFEHTLYERYKPGVSDQPRNEVVSAAWLGEQFAVLLNPASMLAIVQERYPSAVTKVSVAVASLRVAGYRIGSNQPSIVEKVDLSALAEVHRSMVGALAEKSSSRDHPAFKPNELAAEIMKLTDTLTNAFYANASSKPPQPIPHWFVGKEACMFLQNGAGVPNPEEIMLFAEFLSNSMGATKKLFDELLDVGVSIRATASSSRGD